MGSFVSICVSHAFLIFFLTFVLSYSGLFVFVYLLYCCLDIYFFLRRDRNGVHSDMREGEDELGNRNCSQNYYMEKINFIFSFLLFLLSNIFFSTSLPSFPFPFYSFPWPQKILSFSLSYVDSHMPLLKSFLNKRKIEKPCRLNYDFISFFLVI